MNFADREKQRKTKEIVSQITGADTHTPASREKVICSVKRKGRPKLNRETKQRFTLTLLPSNYEKASKIASENGISMSELVDCLIADYVKMN